MNAGIDLLRRFFSAMRECWAGLMMLNTST